MKAANARRPMWLYQIFITLLGLASIYACVVLLFYFWQDKLIYFPHYGGHAATPAQLGLAYESVMLNTDDAVVIHGWYVPAAQARGNLLFFHGNAGDIRLRLDSIRRFHGLGLNVLIIDYRGYGKSQGKPSEAGLYRDARAAWDYLINTKQASAESIVIFGRSLGGAVGAQLASERQPAALILESTFTSATELGAELYPYLPISWILRQRYATQQKLPTIRCPLLIVHGRDDDIIPVTHAHRLYQAAAQPKQLLVLAGGHNTLPGTTPRAYHDGLDKFLRCYLEHDAAACGSPASRE